MANDDEEKVVYNNYCRIAAAALNKFDRYESQELIYNTSSHWLLAPDVLKYQAESKLNVSNDELGSTIILFPYRNDIPAFCYRELHAIIRDLTVGMFAFNQTPTITLDATYDQATICNLSPAYIDTFLGQLLVNTDYMLKALWHGAYFPQDKRLKFAERWRGNLDVNMLGRPETKKSLLGEFLSAGLTDITKDPDYAHIYDQLPVDIPDDEEMEAERKFFMDNIDSLSLQLTFCHDDMYSFRNMYITDSKYLVSSLVRLIDHQINNAGYERLKTRLQMQENVIQEHIANKKEVCRQLELLKLVSYLIPLFIEMRKNQKVPVIQRLLPPYSADETRTEREFPPLMSGPDFISKNFVTTGKYYHLHGGVCFDLEVNEFHDIPAEITSKYDRIVEHAQKELYSHAHIEQGIKEHYNVPLYHIDNKLYYAILIEFESFSANSPQKPIWVKAYSDELDKLKMKRLPISDLHIHEHFKKVFGFKRAIKYKTPLVGIKICAQRGFLAMFAALSRKLMASRLARHDEQGLTFLHYAAIYNRPQIVVRMLMNNIDINVRRNNTLATEYKKVIQALGKTSSSDIVLPKLTKSLSNKSAEVITGPTPLHLAARCGSLDMVSCLWAKNANFTIVDHNGWAPIHYAAYFDHQVIVRFMANKMPELINLETKDELLSTPLLLAASSGALSCVKCLIEVEADHEARDTENNNMVVLAAIRFHTNVLQYLIEKGVPVWQILVEMLSEDNLAKQDSAIKCLEVLSTVNPNYWIYIQNAGAIPAVVKLLSMENQEIQKMAVSLLCKMSEQPSVRKALSTCGAIPILIRLLSSSCKDILSCTCIILADIAHIDDNQTKIAAQGAMLPLVALLDSELEEVLINAANTIRLLCLEHVANQKAVADNGGLDPLVELLQIPSDDLQVTVSVALAAATMKNAENQNYVINKGVHKPLVELIKQSKSTLVQVKAAKALEALATNNPRSQKYFLEIDAPKALIRLLKNVHVQVREQGACSLWSLAGDTRTQQKYIAERISISHIGQMLLEPTEKLLYVGCMTAIALGMEDMASQIKLAKADTIPQLVGLLRSPKTSEKVIHMVIKVIGILCVGVAYRNNTMVQELIAVEGGINVLAALFTSAATDEIKLEVAIALACVTLSFKQNQLILAENTQFSITALTRFLKVKDLELRLKGGMAITMFAFNNKAQQLAFRETKSIKHSTFRKFLNNPDELYQCYAAFQTVILAEVIMDRDPITLTAYGIELLVTKINSTNEKVVVLSCNLLSALAHTRAGLSDAMVSIGVLDLLVKKLSSSNVMIRNGAANTLGYLTFNKTAYRLLFSACRNQPGLYQKIMENTGEYPHINPEFVKDFTTSEAKGLPSAFLEVNGGPIVAKKN